MFVLYWLKRNSGLLLWIVFSILICVIFSNFEKPYEHNTDSYPLNIFNKVK